MYNDYDSIIIVRGNGMARSTSCITLSVLGPSEYHVITFVLFSKDQFPDQNLAAPLAVCLLRYIMKSKVSVKCFSLEDGVFPSVDESLLRFCFKYILARKIAEVTRLFWATFM